jgi:hypothetical protein
MVVNGTKMAVNCTFLPGFYPENGSKMEPNGRQIIQNDSLLKDYMG